VDRTGDSGRLDFRMLGDRALIHLVDGAVPEFEPAQDALGWFRKDVDDEDLAEKQQGLHVAAIGQIHSRRLSR
jgi:hypothetical protein